MTFEAAANLDEVEIGETLLVELSEPVCLIRLDEQDVRAIHNTCSHQHNPLHEGMVDDDNTLVCAAHAARFDLDTGESAGVPEVAAIPVYPCKIEDGTILVDVGQALNDATPSRA